MTHYNIANSGEFNNKWFEGCHVELYNIYLETDHLKHEKGAGRKKKGA